ncbi:MAG: KpsF/GutQ family sugar-phosphate isomerase [Chthonomonas sp.]|nr:KpsF/GutQ family sugar-phosphate isomerase [Chthonomonas sp.]
MEVQTRMSSESISTLQRVLRQEANAIAHLADRLSTAFETAVDWMLAGTGRVICCGIGKSGHVARKTAGTLASTGTPSMFLHAAEAVHGDLGMVTSQDIVLLYTHSGETDELVKLFASLSMIGARTILITGRPDSSAGRLADLVLDTGVTEEACSNNLAPTTSTTVMMALSDALAVAVMEQRGFSREDFARFHPAGALGKRLLLTVRDVMRQGEDLALVVPATPLHDVMELITRAGSGGAIVVGEAGEMLGFISDGDLRRAILADAENLHREASLIMNGDVSVIDPELLAADALETFQNHPRKIGDMPVVERGRVVGMLSLKDLLRSGIF